MKNLRAIFNLAKEEYAWEDNHFPRDRDGRPSMEVIQKLTLTCRRLGHVYKKMTKDGPQELFKRKVAEAESLPEYGETTRQIKEVMTTIPAMIMKMEEQFGSAGKVSVRSE